MAEEDRSFEGNDQQDEPQQTDFKKVGSSYSLGDNIGSSPKKGSKKWLLVVIIGLILLSGFFFRRQIKNLLIPSQPSPTPAPISLSTPTPTATPSPLVRSDWSLEVVNGSGISGLAKKVADQISALGYKIVKVGNADKSDYAKTQIAVKKELADKLDLVIADLKDVIKIASVGGQLSDSTASARIIIGKDAQP